mmetsp:Transcript_7916/g.12972  ORF Transcript_7916/g.12972 Transcript_7916/m.12972 type:complete len:223 (-) Transcript_7916:121-789(-)
MTSGVCTTLPNDQSKAPYTRINCCCEIASALFRIHRILSKLPRSARIASLNSSEMSSLCASNRRMMRSARVDQYETTDAKSYPLAMRCFSPDKMPGESINVMCSNSGAFTSDTSKRFKNDIPNDSSALNGLSRCTAAALPGMTRSCCGLYMTATNLSVVGSGPMREPGKSRSSKYLMKVVLPTEYWPINSTMGAARKSASDINGVINLSKFVLASIGIMYLK